MTAQNSVSDSEELRLLYQITAGDLAYFKTQQWSVTELHIVVVRWCYRCGANAQAERPVVDRVVLVTVTIFVAMSALIILAKLQKSVRVRQSRLDAVRTKFTDAFHLAWSAEDKGVERFHAIYLLRITVVVGAGVVCWLVGLRL